MRFQHKIKKLADPQTLRSARRHLGRILLTRRFVFRLDAARLIAAIDPQQFQEIRERYAIENPGISWQKYLELSEWMTRNLRRVRDLELDYGFRKRILDIGSGAGYFLHICRWLGHDVVGLDIDELPMFGEMTRMLGIKRIIWRVKAFEALPDLGRKFDVITAFMICFNGHKSEHLWGPNEWRFFLDDLESRLNPRGRIRLTLNHENDGSLYTKELREFFENRGAEIDEHRVTFRPGRRASA
jgi:2-polyprenyl-3-methyl-5-hydroxy-6-metoxy-1,4-benzoquinol methylase